MDSVGMRACVSCVYRASYIFTPPSSPCVYRAAAGDTVMHAAARSHMLVSVTQCWGQLLAPRQSSQRPHTHTHVAVMQSLAMAALSYWVNRACTSGCAVGISCWWCSESCAERTPESRGAVCRKVRNQCEHTGTQAKGNWFLSCLWQTQTVQTHNVFLLGLGGIIFFIPSYLSDITPRYTVYDGMTYH